MKSFKPKPWFLPQPVVIIGTYGADGTPNAMNAAWAGQWDANEIMISMGAHATAENINRCPDFTIAFATADTMVAADYVGIVSGRKVADKIKNTGWKVTKAENINAPIFTDFPLSMECRLKEKLYESPSGYYIIAEVVNVVCDENYLAADGNPDAEKMRLIVYDPVHHGYIELGHRIGDAFSCGKKL